MYNRLQILNLNLHPRNLVLFIAEGLGTKNKRKKKGKELVFSNSILERENTVYPTFFVLNGKDGVRAGEFDVLRFRKAMRKPFFTPEPLYLNLKMNLCY